MRLTITCDQCLERMKVERPISEPGPVYVICHRCEVPLKAVVSESSIKRHPVKDPFAFLRR